MALLLEIIEKNNFKNYLNRHVLLRFNRLQHIHNSHPFQHLSENDVFAIQMWCGDSCDEELGAISVGSSVGHAEQAHLVMLQGKGDELLSDRIKQLKRKKTKSKWTDRNAEKR